MPDIRLKHVLSCNSEQKGFPADNVLTLEPSKKWKCQPGEKSATVLVQFEKSTQITAVDIGNENSAFIEILVGRESDRSEDFQVLLPASAFMSPADSRNAKNGSKVRLFKKEDLSASVVENKWDRVKIICSQPFNKSVGYGISFVRLQESGREIEPSSSIGVKKEERTISLGRFKLRVDDEDDALPGSMFLKRKEITNNTQPVPKKTASGPAAIREASKKQDSVGMPAAPLSHQAPVGKSPSFTKTPSLESPGPSSGSSSVHRKQPSSRKSPADGDSPELKRPKVQAGCSTKKKPVKKVPFEKLLEGVVFAISGIQNPERADIRQKGLDLGAKYRPDWGRDCSHLICAFANTPKYNQVKGKGKIAKKEWLIDCHRQKKRLSWRKYAFERKDMEGTDSEDEELVEGDAEESSSSINELIPTNSKQATNGLAQKSTLEPSVVDLWKEEPQKTREEGKGVYDMSTDEAPSSGDESGDTDDEVEKVKARQKRKAVEGETPSSKSPAKLEVGADGLPILPNFFNGYRFLLYGDFAAAERKELRRFIAAFDGKLEEYMGDSVSHVVTKTSWNRDFDDALTENGKLLFVTPEWVMECGRLTRLVDIDTYLIRK